MILHTTSHPTCLRGRIYNRVKKEQGGTGANKHTQQKGNNIPSAATADTLAKKFNVSSKTINTWKGVIKSPFQELPMYWPRKQG
jgi:hypothetical protein